MLPKGQSKLRSIVWSTPSVQTSAHPLTSECPQLGVDSKLALHILSGVTLMKCKAGIEQQVKTKHKIVGR